MSLVLRNISHRFGPVAAVEAADLSAAAGEIVCLFGPSGCGKTTLLRIAAGLERAQAGEVMLNGARLAGNGVHTPPEKRPIGFVFQDYVLFPHMTVRENVAFGLAGVKNARQRIADQLEALDLEGLEKRYPHELSGGQQQRTALARALARKPQALLLDEPFASIDATLRRRLREELRLLLKEQGAAVVMITHDPEEALALGDRIALMRAGRVIETASPETLFQNPATPDGASIFRGAQTIEGAIKGGSMQTPLGRFDAAGLADGPGVVVLRDGAIHATASDNGRARVADARFTGPGWTVLFAVEGLAAPVRAGMESAPAIGARFDFAVQPSCVFVYSNQ